MKFIPVVSKSISVTIGFCTTGVWLFINSYNGSYVTEQNQEGGKASTVRACVRACVTNKYTNETKATRSYRCSG
jgi:hypothetical protein